MIDNDKLLLEKAAKAAGIDLAWHTYEWNPLTDDGDALRLAVKLGMLIDVVDDASGANVINYKFCSEEHNNDPYAATRRAIVRAAASIGEQM